jgi:hypothetical protein
MENLVGSYEERENLKRNDMEIERLEQKKEDLKEKY